MADESIEKTTGEPADPKPQSPPAKSQPQKPAKTTDTTSKLIKLAGFVLASVVIPTSTLVHGWYTARVEEIKAEKANELENLKESHAEGRARAQHATEMRKTLLADAVNSKLPIEHRMSLLRFIRNMRKDEFSKDPAFNTWAEEELIILENARVADAAQPPKEEVVRCKEKDKSPCDTGTVFACVVGYDRDEMAGQTVKTTDRNAIVFGSWSNAECKTSSEGWHMKLGSCSVGGGTLFKQCTEVLARVPLKQR